MKTLDEVIKAFEICIGYYCSNAEHDVCPYLGESDMGCMKEPEKDALHYLKEYKRVQNKIEKIALGNIEDTLDKLDNKPLTWNELRQMCGKPVWVVVVDGKERWRIIREVTNEHLILESGLPLHKSWMNHPDGWQAYRKEKK